MKDAPIAVTNGDSQKAATEEDARPSDVSEKPDIGSPSAITAWPRARGALTLHVLI